MKIILNNGTELSPIVVKGSKQTVQGAMRDVLSFVFPAEDGMDALDMAFSSPACESITIVDDKGNENIHKAYTVRVGLKKETVEVAPATADTEAVTEERITVSMGQRTYQESQIASLTDTVDVLVMESLMG